MRRRASRRLQGLAVASFVLFPACSAWLFMAPAAADSTSGSGEGVTPWLAGMEFPVQLAFSTDGRAFFTERFSGNIRVIDASGPVPVVLQTPLANVGPLNTSGEQGLLGLALDPDFAVSPWVYVYHTFDDGVTHENRITRFWAASNTSDLSELVMGGIPAAFFHNGGILKFGRDGKLYVTLGDATNGGRVQSTAHLNGKTLRMEKNGSVPADNPWPGQYQYTMGHRNVFGIDENPRTGRMYITENGDLTNDELNMLVPGANYGWPLVNGTAGDARFQDPLWAISPTVAPTGIAFDASSHSGAGPVDLYVADWNTASVRRFVLEPPNYDAVSQEQILLTRSTPSIVSLTFGPGGRLYIITPTEIYTSDLRVVGNRPPVPSIYVSRPVQFVGANISFGGGDSFDPEGGGIYSHKWDFGDGTSATGQWTSKSYGQPGNYTVTLAVTDEQGTSNSTSVNVMVVALADNRPPVPRLYQNRSIQFVGLNVSFGGGESFDPEWGGIKSYHWDLGDGTIANGSWATHAYARPGTYVVRLTVMDEFDVAAGTSVDFLVLEEWQNEAPTSIPGLAQSPAFAGYTTFFTAAASVDREGGLKGHAWDFGDGGAAQNATPWHTYGRPGLYNVTLTVTDELGAQGTGTMVLAVLDASTNRAPAARITPPSGLPVNGEVLAFSASASTDPEGGTLSYLWSFGNGGRGKGENVLFMYSAPGLYTVELEAFDRLGAVGRAIYTLRVYQVGTPPVVSFVMNDWYAPLGDGHYFDGIASYDPEPGGYVADAWWDFGDGQTVHGLQVWHYYREQGQYNVTLTVLTGRGTVASNWTWVTVGPPKEPASLVIPIAMGTIVLAAVGAALAIRPRKVP